MLITIHLFLIENGITTKKHQIYDKDGGSAYYLFLKQMLRKLEGGEGDIF